VIPLDPEGDQLDDHDPTAHKRMAMSSRRRISLIAACLLSFLALPVFTKYAYAIAIDNDAVIDWQQDAYLNFTPLVTNGNFLVSADNLATVFIDIAITRSDLLGGFTLLVDVVNPIPSAPNDYTEILVGGSPLKLTFAAGYDNNGNNTLQAPNPAGDTDLGGGSLDQNGNFIPPDPVKSLNRSLSLSALQNSLQTFTLIDENNPNLGGTWSGPTTSAVLAPLLGSGPLLFSINATFNGNFLVPNNDNCQDEEPASGTVCPTFPGSASITVRNGGAFPPTDPPNTVPEPGSLSLLLAGVAGIAGLKLRRR
jgi:PEP-CTERM motif-containing protein